jgi:hypothetical protein
MSDHLADLKKLCRSAPANSEERLVEIGDTMWLMGRPVRAEKGMIAIAQSEDLHIIVRERDIIEVERNEDVFLVKVRSEANLLIRFERVVKAVPQNCACEPVTEKPSSPPTSLQRQIGTGPWGVPLGPCRLYTYCEYFGGRIICWWYIFCPSRVGRI